MSPALLPGTSISSVNVTEPSSTGTAPARYLDMSSSSLLLLFTYFLVFFVAVGGGFQPLLEVDSVVVELLSDSLYVAGVFALAGLSLLAEGKETDFVFEASAVGEVPACCASLLSRSASAFNLAASSCAFFICS